MAEEQEQQSEIWNLVNQATFTSDLAVRAGLIQRLAHQPEAFIIAIQALPGGFPGKAHRAVTMEVLRAIGYPQNAKALPLIISIATDPNDPGGKEATTTLLQIAPEIVMPSLIEILWDRGKKRCEWDWDVRDICWWMQRNMSDRTYLLHCGPVIASLLSQRYLWKDWEEAEDLTESLVNTLIAIGTEGADYILPVLLSLLEEEGATDLGHRIRDAITAFGHEHLWPYAAILPSTGEDKSTTRRAGD